MGHSATQPIPRVRLARLDGDSPRVRELRGAVLRHRLGPGQNRFAPPAAHTLPRADADPYRVPFAVVYRDRAVGFGILDRAGPLREITDDPVGAVLLRAFYIDFRWQGRGLGRAACAALPSLVRSVAPAATALLLTVDRDNHAARRTYLASGFTDTGRVHSDGEATRSVLARAETRRFRTPPPVPGRRVGCGPLDDGDGPDRSRPETLATPAGRGGRAVHHGGRGPRGGRTVASGRGTTAPWRAEDEEKRPVSTKAHERAREAADTLRSRTGVDSYGTALVMGSGWAPAADALGSAGTEFDVSELPGFLAPTVAGHRSTVRSVRAAGGDLLVFLGRTHLYENRGIEAVVHGVRTAVAAGAARIVLTNAAGSLNADLRTGQPVLISDHINLTARSPIVGANFVDLTDTYSPQLRKIALEAEPSLPEGVYAAVTGPHFETPAEIRMLRTMGADLVGMSTALEAIAAREMGASVLGISLVTNVAAGLSGEPLDHQEVLEAGRGAADDVGRLLKGIVDRI